MRIILLLGLLLSTNLYSQDIPARWEELTASDWSLALQKSSKTIILPIGILEKHGPHAPIGSDLINVRAWAMGAVENEYAVVFPEYFYGQINEAKNHPGTFALPDKLAFELLKATCEELGRNGFEKILIVNGHGGNPQMLRYFVQTQLDEKKDYAVYFFDPQHDQAFQEKVNSMRKSDPAGDQHGGENETSALLYLRPDLVQLDRAKQESGENQKRLPGIPNIYTGIWWYAAYPNHYAGEGDKATKELGKLLTDHKIEALTKALKAVKEDTQTLKLQNQFFEDVDELSQDKP
ncbi:creatininase family protein [Antarcticibacterium sp. 1MA-6-2]|uniref:creatininase family protein n=1 Tax=Antarcticibacterium sp. 1MA-6-2 TaxID=2908210 RepID=UPI001F2A1C82|nr:creatininase family protein [Antarcticibacterium sp. 1MA-6-2]UJH91456.1 creatininase family protein [Antarcticibacterium sp. 1MA-6-2]